ncbi:MAG: hypothetical protein WC096_07665 [Sphaerochaetaceae bacterium]|jgi:hypothetical protein
MTYTEAQELLDRLDEAEMAGRQDEARRMRIHLADMGIEFGGGSSPNGHTGYYPVAIGGKYMGKGV